MRAKILEICGYELTTFLRNVRREGECWRWNGTKNPAGYPHVSVNRGPGLGRSLITGARMSWQFFHGPIEEGDKISTTCGHRDCVNPAHLACNVVNNAPKAPARGERAARAKLTTEQVLAIRAAHAGGSTAVSLAKMHGVSNRLIGLIVARRVWTHV